MGIRLYEHQSIAFKLFNNPSSFSFQEELVDAALFDLLKNITPKAFTKQASCFLVENHSNHIVLKADYYIGLDWLGNTKRTLYVEPKINKQSTTIFTTHLETIDSDELKNSVADSLDTYELDYLAMLTQVMLVLQSYEQIENVLHIDWKAPTIAVEQKQDRLTPFLIIQFLQVLKQLVKKGLKKSYYRVNENLNNKVRGKIVIATHIKQNVLKNRLTTTNCEYQVFGEDYLENQFLKKVLNFVQSYLESHKVLLTKQYKELKQIIAYCTPVFELVSTGCDVNEIKNTKQHAFYKEYGLAINLGNHILKRFAYTISKASDQKVNIPPFWIDMPRLFELYVYSKMIEGNPEFKKDIHFQFSTHGNALDILVSHPDYQIIIDAKYKLHYQKGHLHEDIRQVAGYARLKKVRQKLGIADEADKTIPCLIIYPDIENGVEELSFKTIKEKIEDKKQEITPYYKVYKLGIKLPLI